MLLFYCYEDNDEDVWVKYTADTLVAGAGPGAGYSYHGGGNGGKGGGYYQDRNTTNYYGWNYPSFQELIGGSTGKGELKIRAGKGGGGGGGEEKGGVTNRTETLLSIMDGICPSVQVLIGGSTGKGSIGPSPSPSTFDTIHPIDMKLGTYNKFHLYFQLNETTWYRIGFHGNNSQINDVTFGRHPGFLDFQILFKFSVLYFKMTRKQHLAIENLQNS